jgi:hypothetical protein
MAIQVHGREEALEDASHLRAARLRSDVEK